jgi:hypothetical protein
VTNRFPERLFYVVTGATAIALLWTVINAPVATGNVVKGKIVSCGPSMARGANYSRNAYRLCRIEPVFAEPIYLKLTDQDIPKTEVSLTEFRHRVTGAPYYTIKK